MNKRLKISIGVASLLLAIIAFVGFQNGNFKADENLSLTSLLEGRATEFSACDSREENECQSFVEKSSTIKQVNGHLQSMIQDVAIGCVSDQKSFNIVIPTKDIKTGSDYWTCSIDSVAKNTTPAGLDQYKAEATVTLESLPSSDKKIIFLDNIPLPGTNQATVTGEQKLELTGTVTGKLLITVTITAGNPNVRVDWQRPKAKEEPKTYMSGSVAANISYHTNSDSLRYGRGGLRPLGGDPGYIAAQSPHHTKTDTKAGLSIGWKINSQIDSKGSIETNNQLGQLSICQPQCTDETTEENVDHYQYDGPNTVSNPEDDIKPDPNLYGTLENKRNNTRTTAMEGLGDPLTGKLFYSNYIFSSKPSSGGNSVKNEGTMLRKNSSGETTHSWHYVGAIDKTTNNDTVRGDKTAAATLNERLDYSSTDKAYNPQHPNQSVNDSGYVTIDNVKATQHNGETSIQTGSASRSVTSAMNFSNKPACPANSRTDQEDSGSNQSLFPRVLTFKASAPLSESLGCFDPFAAINPQMIFHNLDKYDPPHRVSEPGIPLLDTNVEAVPNFITVLFTEPARTPAQIAQKKAILNLLQYQARSRGVAVTVYEPKRLPYKANDIRAILQDKDNNNEEILRKDSWFVVVGKNPANYHASDGIMPTWKVNSILEAKSVKMNVYAPGNCDEGYSNIAESFLPLWGKNENTDDEGITTNNFEYTAADIGNGLKKIMGCT